MRLFFVLMTLMLSVARASAGDVCTEVAERSNARILCTKGDSEYHLNYQDWVVRELTLASGHYDALIAALCADRQVVHETWKLPFRPQEQRTIRCK